MARVELDPHMTIDEALDEINVIPPGLLEEGHGGPEKWWAVETGAGAVVYACDEILACKIRLWLVNDALNRVRDELLCGSFPPEGKDAE